MSKRKSEFPVVNPLDLVYNLNNTDKANTISDITFRINHVLNTITENPDVFYMEDLNNINRKFDVKNYCQKLKEYKTDPTLIFLHFLVSKFRVNPIYILLGEGEKFIK